jgi:UDP-N-acetylmuramate-alanine ligase
MATERAKMLSAHAYTRIKANAQVFGVDLTQVDDVILFKIVRAAKANQWAIVEETIMAVAS